MGNKVSSQDIIARINMFCDSITDSGFGDLRTAIEQVKQQLTWQPIENLARYGHPVELTDGHNTTIGCLFHDDYTDADGKEYPDYYGYSGESGRCKKCNGLMAHDLSFKPTHYREIGDLPQPPQEES